MNTVPSTSGVVERVQFRSPLQFRRQNVTPVSPSSDYTVQVLVCGVCRSDVHFAESWARDWSDEGHEFGGVVVEKRRHDGQFSIGDRVVIRNAAACGQCPPCAAGNPRHCQRIIVNKQGYGTFAYCAERSLVSAGSLPDELMALVEPVNVVLDLLHSAGVGPGHRVLVFGSGTLGLLAAYLAERWMKASAVVTVNRNGVQPPVAERLGLEDAVPMTDLRYHHHVGQLGGPADCVLVTTPPSTLAAALDACGSGGTVSVLGLDSEDCLKAEIDIRTLIFKRAQIQGVFAVPNLYFEEAVNVLETHGDDLAGIISHRVPLSSLEEAMHRMHAESGYSGKTIVRVSEGVPVS